MPQCPNTMGSVSSPCSAGSRWTRVAILENDQVTFVTPGLMTVSSGTAGWDLSFGGVTRTTISNFLGNIWPTATNVTFPATFVVCSVQEVIGSIVQLSFANLTCPTGRNLQFAILNPPITFGTVNTSNTQQLRAQDATFATLSGTPDVLILQTLNVACQGTPTYFGYGGNFYQFDPRLVLLTNTPTSPSSITPVTGVSRYVNLMFLPLAVLLYFLPRLQVCECCQDFLERRLLRHHQRLPWNVSGLRIAL